ncbi:hypothetical protein QLL95_gp0433 [Cotonvirus japonicus]|uniref:PITH domain-containing protein n=1 Tax=Cotonvirus japonicus TaxID=2811091 RepID=A0ABM7NU24_9VIRU|nr:hypothetical protein QLL95_gp0433 [Cotonvirus japonicus]BCS83690.1 hypothetical protein [Cotonvirus japonicus]
MNMCDKTNDMNMCDKTNDMNMCDKTNDMNMCDENNDINNDVNKMLDSVSQYLSEKFNELFNTNKFCKLYGQINNIDWVPQKDFTTHLKLLIFLAHKYPYNCIGAMHYENLDSRGVIDLERYDLFSHLEIACLDPGRDVKDVTLYAKCRLPCSNNTDVLQNFDAHKFFTMNVDIDNYNNDNYYKSYDVPIKTITGPYSKLIQFYKFPISFNHNLMIYYLKLFVKVNYVNTNGFIPDCDMIGIKYSFLDTEIRRKFAFEINQ